MTTLRHVRTHFIRGILIVLPTIITFWLLRILFGIVSDNVTPWVLRALAASNVAWVGDWHARFVVPLIGLIAANLVGQRVLAWFEAGVLKIPFVKSIYGGARQLLDAFDPGGKGTFTRVVLVQYPRAGVYTVGFVTSEVCDLGEDGGKI